MLEAETDGAAVEVTTDKATYSAAKVILTAGPWIAKFLPPEYAAALRVYRQTLCWFALERNPERYSPERFPVFIWITGSRVQDMLYGFPAIDGSAGGIKVATERYERHGRSRRRAARRQRRIDRRNVFRVHRAALPRPRAAVACALRLASTPSRLTPSSSSITPTPAQNILFASACSGHGFKHSPAVGEALAQRALGLPTTIDLSAVRHEAVRRGHCTVVVFSCAATRRRNLTRPASSIRLLRIRHLWTSRVVARI